MPSSAISRSVVCRSRRRRALLAVALVRRWLDPGSDICTVRSYNIWELSRRAQRRQTSSSSAAASSALRRPSPWRAAGARRPRRGKAAGRARARARAGRGSSARRRIPDESYLELGVRALERWRAIEAGSGETARPTGALTTGAFAERAAALRAAGEQAELLGAADEATRFGVGAQRGAPSARGRRDPRRSRARRALSWPERPALRCTSGSAVVAVEPAESADGRRRGAVTLRCGGGRGRTLERAPARRAGIELLSRSRQTVVYLSLRESGQSARGADGLRRR